MLDAKEVLAKVDIVDVIRSYIPVQVSGKSLKAICPFHDDTNPSLSISREKQLFKCFSCGTGGNAITFVQKYEQIPFRQALEKVAVEFAHMDVKHEAAKPKYDPETMRLFQMHKDVCDYANYCLRTAPGEDALEYLVRRNISMEQIDHSMIGYIPDEDELHRFLLQKGYTEQEMEAGGLFHNHRCMFAKRILFPVQNSDGYTCGYTSRRLHEDASAKYINSRESSIFQKNKLIYHLSDALKNTFKRELVLVEGTTDVFGLERIGNQQGIATLGTALTEEHAKLLAKLHAEVTLCYDGDAAGRAATLRSYHILHNAKIPTKVAVLPNGMDPDECSVHHPDQLRDAVKHAGNVFDFYLSTMPDFQNYAEKQAYILNYLKDLAKEDVLMQEEYINRISKEVEMSSIVLKERMLAMVPNEESEHITERHREPKQSYQPNNSKSQAKPKKALLKQRVKNKMEFRKEITKNYDRLVENRQVIAFDQNSVLDRSDILEKYLFTKGPVLETQVTVLEDKELCDYRAQAICEEAVKVICNENKIPKANVNYIAYLHKDTTYPHIHLQVWQKEPYLSKFAMGNHFFQNLQRQIDQVMEKPLDLTKNPLIAEELSSGDIEVSPITIN